mmetsp:Transcript_34465/g.91483  ORF Transcript_34465/g.91483 Transcript_34465/m.91483 type:complete len:97 (+) Transcript_34465:468-758(+)
MEGLLFKKSHSPCKVVHYHKSRELVGPRFRRHRRHVGRRGAGGGSLAAVSLHQYPSESANRTVSEHGFRTAGQGRKGDKTLADPPPHKRRARSTGV